MTMIKKGFNVPGVKAPRPNERMLKVLMSPELGDTNDLTILISIIPPGSTTGLHTHHGDEYMYVVSGRGESIENGQVSPIEPDSLIVACGGNEHGIRNTGDESLKLFCIFCPALEPVGCFLEAIEAAKTETPVK
ncbi:MAG: cupin domain-containing protein [Victivallaceae bacterium]|nr:cupin domain-containing protein [Victivallaceae bacterium]